MSKSIYDDMQLTDLSYLLDPSLNKNETASKQDISDDVINISLDDTVAFKNHPFRMDTESEEFQQLVDSIKENGIIYPILVRPLPNGKYEIISGHCRVAASREAGLTDISAKVVAMDDFDATVLMVHSNFYGRGKIAISEKAKAYRMCMDAERHQGKKGGTETAVLVGQGQDSRRSVYRYIRLSYLSDWYLAYIDNGRLPISTGQDLSYLDAATQDVLQQYIETVGCLMPTAEQAARLRKQFEDTGASLSYEMVIAIMNDNYAEAAPATVKNTAKVTFKITDIEEYFDSGTTPEIMSKIMIMLLEKYRAGEFDDVIRSAEQ